MEMFEIDENTMINLESLDYVMFDDIEGQKVVIIGIGSRAFVVPLSRHKEFFTQVVKLGAIPTKQFVSL
jgi:hypothetical protein